MIVMKMDKFMEKIMETCPDAIFDENDGELVVSTGFKVVIASGGTEWIDDYVDRTNT